MRLNDYIRPPCRKGYKPRCFIVVILQLDRLQTGGNVLVAPFQQNTLLIGAGADDDTQPRRILRLPDSAYATVGLDEEAVETLPVGGEVELFLALLRDTYIRDHRIVFARR